MYNFQPWVFQVPVLASVASPSWWWAGVSPADTNSASGQSGVWCLSNLGSQTIFSTHKKKLDV